MPRLNRVNWTKRNVMQRCCPAYCQLAGGGFTYHPAARRTATAGAPVCAWALRLLGAGDELFQADTRYRVERLPGRLSLWENDYPDNFYLDCWYECGFREFDGPPQPGDMVIMQVQADKWNHAGILLEGNMLLHHLYGHLSQRVPYGGYWQERTMKVLRYKVFC